jgi:hypothetical protein
VQKVSITMGETPSKLTVCKARCCAQLCTYITLQNKAPAVSDNDIHTLSQLVTKREVHALHSIPCANTLHGYVVSTYLGEGVKSFTWNRKLVGLSRFQH